MSDDKNMADVADKALDKVSGALVSMMDAAKKVAPHAWEIMVRQQVIEGVVYACLCVVFIAIGVVTAVKIRPLWKNAGNVPDGPIAVFGSMAAAIFVLVSLVQVPGYVMRAANPEYYAIQALLSAAK